MIAKLEQPLPEPEPEPVVPPDPIKAFWLLLNTVGGSISISKEHLAALPEDVPLEITQDEFMWHFKIPGKKKRNRSIIKPSRRLILPGG
jgi:hypothetical protein